MSCPVSTIPLSFFRCRFAVAVSRCRFRTPLLPLPYALIGWPATERNNGKIELDPISTEELLRQLFAERRNFSTAERQNGNGRTATEWWKPGISQTCGQRPNWVKITRIYSTKGIPCYSC